MGRFNRISLFILIVSFGALGSSSASTHYVAASGSDSNDGASKSSPWSHAPGMPDCTSTCAAYKPAPGDQIIFRGGDTWHYGAGSPSVGGSWRWTWSGSSGNPIYIGVDQTWFSGGSFARPVLSGDNPISTSFPSSCAHDESTLFFVDLSSTSYVTFDNFEFPGKCWSGQINGSSSASIAMSSASNVIVSNCYFHGWTATTSSYDNNYSILGGGGAGVADHNQFVGDIFDGSDSSRASGPNDPNCHWGAFPASDLCQSGQGIYFSAYDVHNCIFRYLSNMMVTTNTHTVHDNVFEYLYGTYGSGLQQHPNVLNNIANTSGQNIYFYNNIIRHTYVTEDVYLAVTNTAYVFNNVFYDNMNVPNFGIISTGFFRFNRVSNSISSTSAYIYNNTIDVNSEFNFDGANAPLTAWNGTAYFENNHLIGFGTQALTSIYTCITSETCSIVDNGHETYQSEATANGQGYTPGNNYAPASGGATIGAGANLSSSCATFSSDSALCSGTSGAVAEESGSGGKIASYPAVPVVARPSSGAWDAGAYFYGSASSSAPASPTALSATVQ